MDTRKAYEWHFEDVTFTFLKPNCSDYKKTVIVVFEDAYGVIYCKTVLISKIKELCYGITDADVQEIKDKLFE